MRFLCRCLQLPELLSGHHMSLHWAMAQKVALSAHCLVGGQAGPCLQLVLCVAVRAWMCLLTVLSRVHVTVFGNG